MSGDLTTSAVARQNILNNPYAIAEIEKAVGIRGIPFEGTYVVLKEQVADFFEVTVRTIETYCADNALELSKNGYAVLTGNRLKSFKKAVSDADGPEDNFGTIDKTSQLAIFTFRAFLNLAMLLADSDRARLLRQLILDIAIDAVNRRVGGPTKYINQRDDEYLQAAFAGESYRKQFTDALKDCLAMGNFKYAVYTDKVYQAIFREKAKEYRRILNLDSCDKTRSTFYSEVLNLIASFEYGFADALWDGYRKKNRKLSPREADLILDGLASLPLYKPLMETARAKMASRDFALRDAYHDKLKEYITSVPREDFERFLGAQSKELADRLEEAKDVLKRLKDR
ncbi:MAG: DNA-binding protein [Rhodomicrobium sp.]